MRFNKDGQPILLGELSGSNGGLLNVAAGTTYKGNYGTSPTKAWSVVTGGSSSFKIKFDQPINAFGFNGIDMGDFDGQLGVKTFRNGAQVNSLSVPLATGTSAEASVLFYGFVNSEGASFDTIEFDTQNVVAKTPGEQDIFTFDDIIAAFWSQTTNTYNQQYQYTLQPYAANPQLLLSSALNQQIAAIQTAGKCDRYGWVLDDIDMTTPAFRYLHGNVTNDWRLCIFSDGGQDFASIPNQSQYGGYNIQSNFFRAGLEYRLNNQYILGGFYALATPALTNFSNSYTSASVTNSFSSGNLYLNYKPTPKVEINLIGSVGTVNSTSSRYFDYSDYLYSNAAANWSSLVTGIGFDIGYLHYFSKYKTRYSPLLRPSFGYNYISSASPSVQETGSGELANINPYSVFGNFYNAGIKLEYPIKMDPDGVTLFIPKLQLGYFYNPNGSDHSLFTISGYNVSDSAPLQSSAALFTGSLFKAALSGEFNMGDSFALYFGLSSSLYATGFGYGYEGGIRVRI